MSDLIRDFSTNMSIGAWYRVYSEIRQYLVNNPPKEGEKQLIDYLHEFGITEYSQIMHLTSHVRFTDAHLLGSKSTNR
jgi:hypothetical protein